MRLEVVMREIESNSAGYGTDGDFTKQVLLQVLPR